MKLTKVLSLVALAATLTFTSCKPSDADIKAKIEAAFKADPTSAATMVDVKDGVATISGICADDACKAACEKAAAGIKGVTSVVNNCTIPAPVVATVPASVATSLTAAVQQKVKDGLKDIAGVMVDFAADKAMLSGAVSKADRMKIMQMLASAKVKSDVSKLTTK